MVRTPVLLLAAAVAGAVALGADLRAQESEANGNRQRYARTPDALVPYRRTGTPARRFFTEPPAFRGPGRTSTAPSGLRAVRLGVLAPLTGIDAAAGRNMVRGVRLALEEANASGGFGARALPFEMVVRDENASWGAAADAGVELLGEHGVWGLIGGYEDANTHVLARVLLKLEVPTINSAGVDPTLTEHNVPWLVRVRPDDRQAAYRLVRRVFEVDGCRRVVLFRANSRYGRTGTAEFRQAARRLHRPILLETRYEERESAWGARMERIRALEPDAVVLWGRPRATGAALRELRRAGIDCPAYGPDRAVGPGFVETAGAAAEGFVFAYPFDPDSDAPRWRGFRDTYQQRFGALPDPTAAYSYDAARLLVAATRRAGLNRVRIRDELFASSTVAGVAGAIQLDVTGNSVSPVILGHVEDGRLVFDD